MPNNRRVGRAQKFRKGIESEHGVQGDSMMYPGVSGAPGGPSRVPVHEEENGPEIADFTGQVWVETPTEGGSKAYFYNVKTRETTWKRPAGHDVKILSQQEMERLRQKLIREEEQKVLQGLEQQGQEQQRHQLVHEQEVLQRLERQRDEEMRLELIHEQQRQQQLPELHQRTSSSSGTHRQSGSREPENEMDTAGETWTEEDSQKLKEMESRLALIERREREIERKKRKVHGRKRPLKELPLQELQAVVMMSRVYVGSINFEVKEDAFRQAFLPFGPIKDVAMSQDPITRKHKGFGFVNYQMPEAAELAINQMNGAVLFGRIIKVGRPSQIELAQTVIDGIRSTAEDLNRIYVASVHQDFTEEMLIGLFEAFGTVTFCELAMSANPVQGRNEGYGFIEYESKQSAEEAITSMNLFDLGGKKLRVGRAIMPPDVQIPVTNLPSTSPAAAIAAANAAAKVQAAENAKLMAATTAKIQAEVAAAAITATIKAAEAAPPNNISSSSEGLRCDPKRGCVSEEMDEECSECPCYAIIAKEALKCGPDGGARLIAASVDNENQSLDLVKTCPIPGTFFRLKSQVLPVKKRTLEMTVALAPTEEGINVARGDILGRCQKISRAWADEVRKFHRKHRAEIVLDDSEDPGLTPRKRVKKRVRLLRPDEKGFEPFDQIVATSYSERVTVCGPGLIGQPGAPFELTLENTSGSVVLLARKKPIGCARHVNTFGGSLS